MSPHGLSHDAFELSMTFPSPPSPRDRFPDDRYLSAYLAGETDVESQAVVDAWRVLSPENEAALEILRTAWDSSHRPQIQGNFEQFFSGVLANIAAANGTAAPPTTSHSTVVHPTASIPTPRHLRKAMAGRRTVWLAAAVACMGLVTIAKLFQPATRATLPAGTYTTHIGQRATIWLADGTRVILAPNTSIVVDAAFGKHNRDVQLTGQAYFDVTSQAGHPFTIRSGDVVSRVLGTEFTIRHYPDDRDVTIAVKSGKVAVGRRTPVIVAGNMVAHVTDSTARLTATTDLRQYIGWTRGQLVFQQTPIADVATIIGQWYGLKFQFADSTMKRQHLTGAFDESDTREEVLQSLKILLNAQMTFEDNVVTLIPLRSAATPRIRPGLDSTWMISTKRGFGR